jgi:acetyl esterase/lipase
LLYDGFFLIVYVILLLPGFLPMAWFYFTTPHRISIRYKTDSCRNTLDVYGSSSAGIDGAGDSRTGSSCTSSVDDGSSSIGAGGGDVEAPALLSSKPLVLKPVLFFLPGGAFIIGYKMWAALSGQALMFNGILIVVADYRNYPWGTIPDMVIDAQDALDYTIEHCRKWGGDPDQLVVVGQSAGAHLGLVTVLLSSSLSSSSPSLQTGGGTVHQMKSSQPVREPERIELEQHQPFVDEPSSELELESTSTSYTLNTLSSSLLPNNATKRRIQGFVGMSGVYSMQEMIPLCAKHGLSSTFVTKRLLGNRASECDPTEWLLTLQQQEQQQQEQQELVSLSKSLPPIELWHGMADRTVRV